MKTHWKKLTNPDYLGAYEFQPEEIKELTIKVVKREMITGMAGKKEECTVAHFEEPIKPMILNNTNCKSISKAYKTPYIEDWTGLVIKLKVSLIDAFGDKDVPAVRVIAEKVVNVDVTKEIAGIRDTLTVDELKTFFLSLSPELQRNKKVIAAKNEKYGLLNTKK